MIYYNCGREDNRQLWTLHDCGKNDDIAVPKKWASSFSILDKRPLRIYEATTGRKFSAHASNVNPRFKPQSHILFFD